ncbi:hypothetical protein GCM10023189_28960 [Nibrella saemangeumensis]|uniref:Signal transduction histidine kinase internal region domain-containing protein n=1 Tax=Nibrella saemangeumensis TaxID=1084526 RepID=A0ABP8MXD5_9BACT
MPANHSRLMESTVPLNLTLSQKVRLAASVFAIYWPIRLYLNIDHWSWTTFRYVWVLWLLEIPLTILFITGWLSVTEWLEEKFFSKSRRDYLIDVKWSAQLATFLTAGALAVMFNVGFHLLLRQLDLVVGRQGIRTVAMRTIPAQEQRTPPSPGWNADRRRRDKANNGLTVLAMLMAFYLSANRRGYRELAQLRINAEQLKREATQAQFVALRNQVNPHFLFNSLSILASLVEVDQKLSVRFIKQLSKVYRYILDQRDTERVSLKTELDFLEAYSFLLNIRFEGKLQVLNKVTAPEAMRYGIAPLTLQLLVENAVKHNQMSAEQPLIVSIETSDDYLLVSNPLQRRPQAEDSTGMGLENITNRYRLLTDRPVSIGEENNSFVIKLPLLS